MKYRILGRTGLNVSVIGLGCEGFMDLTQTQTTEMIEYAIQNGINIIDIYSSNPELRQHLGKAIKPHRKNFLIQSHIGSIWENGQYLRTRDMDKVKNGFETSLKELDTDYLDIGIIHYVDEMEDFERVFNGEIIQYALQLKANGTIHHLGMSTHNPLTAIKAVETGLIDTLLFSINPCYDLQPATEDIEVLLARESYNKHFTDIDKDRRTLYELCERKGIAIDVMKAYGGGDILSDTLSPFGKALTPIQCIEYCLERPSVASVLIGCKNIEEMESALKWCSATEKEKDYTNILNSLDSFSWHGHCMYCGHCAPCPKGINIAMVNKLYNLALAEGCITETIREHYKILNAHASDCIGCGQCETRCPFEVKIKEKMKNIKNLFGL